MSGVGVMVCPVHGVTPIVGLGEAAVTLECGAIGYRDQWGNDWFNMGGHEVAASESEAVPARPEDLGAILSAINDLLPMLTDSQWQRFVTRASKMIGREDTRRYGRSAR